MAIVKPSTHFVQLPEEQFPLASKFFKSARYSPKVSKRDDIFVLKHAQTKQILAATRLSALDNYCLLRSMVVAPEFRRCGLGTELLHQLNTPLQTKDCWCFPFDHLCSFYSNANFAQVSVSDSPQAISSKYLQYTQHGKKLIIMHRQKTH